jgi:hypothetical protein
MPNRSKVLRASRSMRVTVTIPHGEGAAKAVERGGTACSFDLLSLLDEALGYDDMTTAFTRIAS